MPVLEQLEAFPQPVEIVEVDCIDRRGKSDRKVPG
jgi:hypothetical protein